MGRAKHHFSKQTSIALEHFASLLTIARKSRARPMTIADLSDRLGCTPVTTSKLLKGAPEVGIGLYFEAARILGVPLFDQDPSRLEASRKSNQKMESLLPKRVRPRTEELDNDF